MSAAVPRNDNLLWLDLALGLIRILVCDPRVKYPWDGL